MRKINMADDTLIWARDLLGLEITIKARVTWQRCFLRGNHWETISSHFRLHPHSLLWKVSVASRDGLSKTKQGSGVQFAQVTEGSEGAGMGKTLRPSHFWSPSLPPQASQTHYVSACLKWIQLETLHNEAIYRVHHLIRKKRSPYLRLLWRRRIYKILIFAVFPFAVPSAKWSGLVLHCWRQCEWRFRMGWAHFFIFWKRKRTIIVLVLRCLQKF